ncbi:hypothetical protein [Nonomuraea turcica]|nr:hypothetical protein [Nonomuraea sp. G32]MDP4509249.1 hypothetical protein [Nonomuraea sp. G32]
MSHPHQSVSLLDDVDRALIAAIQTDGRATLAKHVRDVRARGSAAR